MNSRIKMMREKFIVDKVQKKEWQEKEDPYVLAKKFEEENTSMKDRAISRLIYVLEKEKPIVYPYEKITFTRSVQTIPELLTENELLSIKETHWIHELGDVSNINVDFMMLIDTGFDNKIAELEEAKKKTVDRSKKEYINGQISILSKILELVSEYRRMAKEIGNDYIYNNLSRVPAKPARTFSEALQFFRVIHFVMWAGRNYHNTLGRFDQYMWKYLKNDLAAGVLSEEDALELIEEFFLTLNRDSDLYPGMQQGDNGQSLVLGGVNLDGSDSYNLLSKLCLEASLNLNIIDPKINLRVSKETPIDIFILGSKLTQKGLGFPQYSNDDVVIPGLIDLGYSRKDAYNYVVAACWEFIIPGKAMDIPNIEAVSFPKAVEDALFIGYKEYNSFSEFIKEVKNQVKNQINDICKKTSNLFIYPSPFISLLMQGDVSEAIDISEGNIYNNYGIHGTGVSSAADSLIAIKRGIFDEKTHSHSIDELRDALTKNFEGYEVLQNMLRFEMPKMGNNIDEVDNIAVDLLSYFSEELSYRKNDRGGRYRGGTGSAMYYIWHTKKLFASPDGRNKDEGLGCNYSPSLFAKCSGPVSIIKSFTKADLRKTINGGPLTLELHDTLFRNEDSLIKVAYMVKSFIDLGGHQLQLNAINRETLIQAQKKPENFKNLIVRVWGWSGYFVELDKEYQNHVIQRMELTL